MIKINKKLRTFKEVEKYIDNYDYELAYLEYEQLKNKEFYKIDGGYIAVETLSSLLQDYNYVFSECESLEEFLDEMDYLLFEDFLLI